MIVASIMIGFETSLINQTIFSQLRGHVTYMYVINAGMSPNQINTIIRHCNLNNIIINVVNCDSGSYTDAMNNGIEYIRIAHNPDYTIILTDVMKIHNVNDMFSVMKNYVDDEEVSGIRVRVSSPNIVASANIRIVKHNVEWLYKGRVFSRVIPANQTKTIIDIINVHFICEYTIPSDYDELRRMIDIDVLENPDDIFILFNAAQIYELSGIYNIAYEYYANCTESNELSNDSLYVACHKCGVLSELLSLPWSISLAWYMETFELSSRAEPVVCIAHHYKNNNWRLCYTFAKLACDLPLPSENSVIPYSKKVYDTTRWELLTLAGHECNNLM